MQSRDKSKGNTRQDGNTESERNHAGVNVISFARGRSGGPNAISASMLHQARNSPAAPPRIESSERFRKKLPNDLSTACPERGANRNFALARRGTREQQIRDIGARDKQHESNRREQHQQRRPHVTDHIVMQRSDEFTASGVGIGILLRQLRGDRLQIRRRLTKIDARFQAADNGKKMRPATHVHPRASKSQQRHQRRDIIDIFIVHRELPSPRHDAE